MPVVDRDPRALITRLRREGVIWSGSSGSIDSVGGGPGAVFSTGIPELDDRLGGGLPNGRISEVVSRHSGGRTGFLWRVLAGVGGGGARTTTAATTNKSATTNATTSVVGVRGVLIDCEEGFDPEGAASAGVDLGGLWWVRPVGVKEAFRAADLVLSAGGVGVVVLDLGGGAGREGREGVWLRLSQRAQRSGVPLVVSSCRREAGTFAAVALSLRRDRVSWEGGCGGPWLLGGVEFRIEVLRSRVGGIRDGERVLWRSGRFVGEGRDAA